MQEAPFTHGKYLGSTSTSADIRVPLSIAVAFPTFFVLPVHRQRCEADPRSPSVQFLFLQGQLEGFRRRVTCPEAGRVVHLHIDRGYTVDSPWSAWHDTIAPLETIILICNNEEPLILTDNLI